ncbi:MAG: prepilin-type N-terminal cleavage/methylation domain-containing protein [Deltaproteobacteria bacterium]|nr:prepilin-type N-terminal cleavage/methylation domain-containing protein [Deltaproteobacteria bacterium]MBW2503356.1 prepilin-type N-terminal cleavage/methylation domain-containing protein [Deltaproteobacteria bacterium]
MKTKPWAKTSTNSRGFTLLEVMIAVSILSIALISLLALANRSLHIHDRTQRITAATLLAQQKMAETEISARQGSLETQEKAGVFKEPHEDFQWQILFADTPLPSVRMVTVTVFWGNEDLDEQVNLTSFLF